MNAPVDVTDIRIETERLVLRPWRGSDLPDFYEYASVDGVGQMAGWLPHKDIARTKTVLDCLIRDKENFALVLKATGKVIGSIGFESREVTPGIPQALHGREIGYDMNRDFWGQGLMPEAVRALAEFAFCVHGLDYLTCVPFASNSRSRRVAEKCGFRYVTDFMDSTNFGTEEPAVLYVRFHPNKEGIQ